MSRRVHTLLEHVAETGKENEAHRLLKQALTMQSLCAQMTMSADRLREMSLYFLSEMHRGLEPNNHSSLPMLPSFVYKRNPTVTRVVYALDLGGSNFRVLRMSLKGGKVAGLKAKKFQIPTNVIQKGTAQQLFGFIASCIDTSLVEFGCPEERREPLPLGFTFSFPVQQRTLASGDLIRWTKQFATTGVEGQDVVRLLQEQLSKANIKFKIVALCNDTVGTLITSYFEDTTTEMGVILGTGSNACYWEKCSAIHKCGEAQNQPSGSEMVINMELGNFDSKHLFVLPVTSFDHALDADSTNVGQQRLEKMVSGRYLGEIARRILLDFSKKGILDASIARRLERQYCFESRFVGMCVADHQPGFPVTEGIFLDEFGLKITNLEERRVIAQICALVTSRAAHLSGAVIAACLLKRNRMADATVAVDGSVFEKTPYFKREMLKAIGHVLGPDHGVRLQLTRDGSGIGAGCIAALAA